MHLTAQQLATLKADIAVQFPSATPTEDQNVIIANYYNALSSPTFRVWRTDVSTKEIKQVMNWSEYISRLPAEKSAFELIIADGIVDASNTNTRNGFSDIFSGNQQRTVDLRNALATLSKRNANRIEKLLIVGGGAGTEASPATMGFEGTIDQRDVSEARNLP